MKKVLVNFARNVKLWCNKTIHQFVNKQERLTASSLASKLSLHYDDVTLSLDFRNILKDEIDFLSAVDRCPLLSDPAVINNAVRRYEQLWLPLVADMDDVSAKSIAPPLDVHWVWHCHMLSPINYRSDCKRLVGKTVDHVVKSASELEDCRQVTASLWRERYVDELFDVLTLSNIRYQLDYCEPYQPTSQYNLASAIQRQSKFYHNVSLPHYKDDRFLNTAVDRYRKFLFLKKGNDGVPLVPCYDVDLVWHTHQLHPLIYFEEANKLFGRMLNHDDSLDDRTPGSVQNRAQTLTGLLWAKHYEKKFAANGAMYRGISSKGKLTTPPEFAPEVSDRVQSGEKSVLRLELGSFETCVNRKICEQLLDPFELPRIRPYVCDANNWKSATHRFVDDGGLVQYYCRVVHSVPLATYVCQVSTRGQPVAISHLIGSDQLPSRAQISGDNCPYLDVDDGERAMIVRDNFGDWAVVVGGWINSIGREDSAASLRNGTTASQGHFRARIYQLRSAQRMVYHIKKPPNSSWSWSFRMDDTTVVDLKHGGSLIVDGSRPSSPVDVAQKCCLAVTVSILHVLCHLQRMTRSSTPKKEGEGRGRTSDGGGGGCGFGGCLGNLGGSSSSSCGSSGSCSGCGD